MANKGYSEGQVVAILRKAQGVTIEGKYVKVNAHVGIKTKGKIDFLTKHCGYTLSQN